MWKIYVDAGRGISKPVKPKPLVIIALVLSLSLLGCQWMGYERREEYVMRPAKGQVRYNGFYAAERLLERLGVEVRSHRQLPKQTQLSRYDTLLMNAPSYTLGAERSEQLLGWVENGGRLILALARRYPANAASEDRLLDALGVTADEHGPISGKPIAVSFGGGTDLRVRFRGRGLVAGKAQAYWSVADGARHALLHYRFGQGAVTVLADLSMFDNAYLDDHDHADFFWALLHMEGEPGVVWLQFSPQIPSLMALVWRHAWMVILSLPVALAALIWASSRRFGPILPPSEGQGRSLLEHIRASGRFLWRRGSGEALLEASRQRLLQAWRKRHGVVDSGVIAARTGLERKHVEAVLNDKTRNAQDFTKLIKLIRQIEKRL